MRGPQRGGGGDPLSNHSPIADISFSLQPLRLTLSPQQILSAVGEAQWYNFGFCLDWHSCHEYCIEFQKEARIYASLFKSKTKVQREGKADIHLFIYSSEPENDSYGA